MDQNEITQVTSDMSERLDRLLSEGHDQMSEPISNRLSRIEETLQSIVTRLGHDDTGWSAEQLDRFSQIEALMRDMFADQSPLPRVSG